MVLFMATHQYKHVVRW